MQLNKYQIQVSNSSTVLLHFSYVSTSLPVPTGTMHLLVTQPLPYYSKNIYKPIKVKTFTSLPDLLMYQ